VTALRKNLCQIPIIDGCGGVISQAISFEEQCKFFRVPQENLINQMAWELRFYVERELKR
jgi:hypothetical protein